MLLKMSQKNVVKQFAPLCIALLTACAVTLCVPSASQALISRWSPTNLTKLSTRVYVACAIDNGKVFCWGANNYGQMGHGDVGVDSLIVSKVDDTGALSGKTVTDVSVGGDQYVCVVASGKAYCWGRNRYNQLGNNDALKADVSAPVAVYDGGVLANKTITGIGTGDGHSCAISDGAAYCWGIGSNGRLGTGNQSSAIAPVAVDTSASSALQGKIVSQLAIGSGHSCSLAEGAVYCWGANVYGQLGNGNTTQQSYPVAVDTSASSALQGKTVTNLGLGSTNNTTCALANGAAYCWGLNAAGQLGIGSSDSNPHSYPLAVSTAGVLNGKTISALGVGNAQACTLATTYEMACWGSYATGGTPATSNYPVAINTTGVLNGITLTGLAVGNGTCAHNATKAYCWGVGNSGRNGNNATTAQNNPVSVLANGDVSSTAYRFYRNANSSEPGVPLAANNTNATIPNSGGAFRVRMGVRPVSTATTPIDILATDASLKLQFSQRTEPTCSAQATGFADVTATSAIAWNTNAGVGNGTAIAASPNDPTVSGAIAYQTYQSADGPFNNPIAINRDDNGIWDFSLRDNGAPASTSYCLKLVYSNGADLESTNTFPSITTSSGVISVSIVDGAGSAVPSPSFPLSNAYVNTQCQTVTGAFGVSSKRIRIENTMSSPGWSLSLAATGGPTALWHRSDNGAYYDFNDFSGVPAGCNSGSDGDGYAGQLSLNFGSTSITPGSSCSNAGVSAGTNSAFSQGAVDSITIAMASGSAETGCYWDITDTQLSQAIPGAQPGGNYSLSMTLTVVAQ